MDRRQKKMVGHGAIIMLFGLIAGFGLLMDLIGGFEIIPGVILEFDLPADSSAWARTHVGGLMNGLLVMVFALLMYAMHLPENMSRHFYWMLVGTGYANTIFYWGGMFSPSRALTLGDNRLGESNLAGVIGLLPAFIFAFVLMVAVIMLALHVFRGSSD